MANATLNFKTSTKQVTRQVVDVQEVKKVSGVTLTLTKHEARTLHSVLRLVGGDPRTSLRAPLARIDDSLKAAGVGYYGNDVGFTTQLCDGRNNNCIIFRDDSHAAANLFDDTLPETQEVLTADSKPVLRIGARIRITWTDGSGEIDRAVGDTGIVTAVGWSGPDICQFTNDRTGETDVYAGLFSKFEVIG